MRVFDELNQRMQLKAKAIILCCLLLCCSWPVVAQSSTQPATAKLFKRYDSGASPHRLNEGVLSLMLELQNKETTRIGIRVCSKEPMPVALVTANADPFYIAKRFVEAFAFLPDRVVYLRAEDCRSPQRPADSVTEVWVVPNGAKLPAHVEAAAASEVKRTAVGKQKVNRGVRDYQVAVEKLIENLRASPTATGVVFGYFLKRPSKLLRQRLQEVTKTFEQSGLPPERYLIRPMQWNDEASDRDKEPSYPTVFLVEITKRLDNATRN